MDKAAIRRAVAAKKRAMRPEEVAAASDRLAELLYATDVYRRAEVLYAYLSFNQEVHTGPIIRRAWADGKRVAVPKTIGREMVFIWLEEFSGLSVSDFGVPEPERDGPVADVPSALVLMPGLAFDGRGHRIGYGGGYYDRYFASRPDHTLVALCYGFQLYDRIDAAPHDIPVDLVLADALSADV